MAGQLVLTADGCYSQLSQYLKKKKTKTLFLVCGHSIRYQKNLYRYFQTLEDRLEIKVVVFSDFQPNPLYDSVVNGVEKFRESNCTMIIAAGGGSAMDVAKCIKLFSNMDPNVNYLEQKIVPNGIALLAIPTTAGTGSEATQYAVVYYNGVKQSVRDYSAIPSAVLFDPSVLTTLPEYQKKVTLLDALCHSIESFWSVNSTKESKEYAKESIRLILENKDRYIAGDESVNSLIFRASYRAGQAINITQTTAGHAMCYKLTTLYHLSHGHAAALVNRELWPWMIENCDKCIDPRGKKYLEETFDELARCMGGASPADAAQHFGEILEELGLNKPEDVREEDYEILKNSVNSVRLKNNPIELDRDTIDMLYHEILK